MVLLKFLFGFDGGDGHHVEVESGDGVVVFLGDVGGEVRKGVDGSACRHYDVWPCEEVGQDAGLIDFLEDLIMLLQFFVILPLQLSLSHVLHPLMLLLLLFVLLLLAALPPELFTPGGVLDGLAVDSLPLGEGDFVDIDGVADQIGVILVEFLGEVDVELGEWGGCSFASFNEDLLGSLEGDVGVDVWVLALEVIGELLESYHFVDLIGSCLRLSMSAKSSFIFSIFLLTSSYYSFLSSWYLVIFSSSWASSRLRFLKGCRSF